MHYELEIFLHVQILIYKSYNLQIIFYLFKTYLQTNCNVALRYDL